MNPFPEINPPLFFQKFKQKQLKGEIDIPITRLGADTQKASLGLQIQDLADYIDRQGVRATQEQNRLLGRTPA
ncbi:pyocin activator PrtN family protein [Pseudomonas sp. B33.4]|uniref:pyocin activator PrtN family protein n=1 Tax=Pseudomonas sp. B33.4 TaxID=3104265 RepID=UPI002ADEDEF9|nr:pyocin activator PrtN family protein [Pseudomonas sp. B33.4]